MKIAVFVAWASDDIFLIKMLLYFFYLYLISDVWVEVFEVVFLFDFLFDVLLSIIDMFLNLDWSVSALAFVCTSNNIIFVFFYFLFFFVLLF